MPPLERPAGPRLTRAPGGPSSCPSFRSAVAAASRLWPKPFGLPAPRWAPATNGTSGFYRLETKRLRIPKLVRHARPPAGRRRLPGLTRRPATPSPPRPQHRPATPSPRGCPPRAAASPPARHRDAARPQGTRSPRPPTSSADALPCSGPPHAVADSRPPPGPAANLVARAQQRPPHAHGGPRGPSAGTSATASRGAGRT